MTVPDNGADPVVAGPVALRNAATVMLVRDGEGGMEVFMLRRSLRAVFVGGAYVFPGGAVDTSDGSANLEGICAGRTDAAASALLDIPGGGLAYWVAAVRECFEEAGVLLAYGSDGTVLSLADPVSRTRFAAHQLAVDRSQRTLVEVCHTEGLTLAVDRIHFFSHWITPPGSPRRFDTRFFVAAAPRHQIPVHDDRETIASLWTRPADALDRYETGELQLINPTIRNLVAIGRFSRTADLLAAAAAVEAGTGAPVPLKADIEGMRIPLPGDPEWALAGFDAGFDPGGVAAE